MRSLIDECSKICEVNFKIDEVFSAGAVTQLCLASGGVPRDFLTLFVKVSNNFDAHANKKISKPNITEAAIKNMTSKNANLRKDTEGDIETLEHYLSYIKQKIVSEKKTNMFLISNNVIDRYSQIKQAIQELVDLRMLHLVDPNTSAAGGTSGMRYMAYMVDIGLYPNSSPISFKQLDPGVTDNSGRKDEMRGAPKIDLDDFQEFIKKNEVGILEITND